MLLAIAVAFGILVAFIVVFVSISRKIRRGGGGATVGMLGATHEILTEDRRRAGEEIIQQKAGKGIEGEKSGDPDVEDRKP
jgi:hypothetical protein